MKFIKLIFVALLVAMAAACSTTSTFEKVITANSIIEADGRFDKVFASAYRVASIDQKAELQNIKNFRLVLKEVLHGKEVSLEKAQMAAQVELYYEKAKASYLNLRSTMNLDQLTPTERWEVQRFDTLVILLDKRIGQMTQEEKYAERKSLVYEMLNVLISSLQMVQFTRV